MNKFLYICFVFSLVFGVGGFFVAEAVNPFDITYPVQELGSCPSQSECKIFCDNPDNLEACVTFAEKQGMIKAPEAKRIKEVKRIQKEQPNEMNGPGGCMTPQECDAFCRAESNLDECLNYGVKNGYTTQEEADRIREQVKKGGPGGCKSKNECDAFCSDPNNADECLNFVVNEGKITKEEAEFMKQQMIKREQEKGQPKGQQKDIENIDKKKVTEILNTQVGPGGCKNMEECNAYCSDFSHGEECMQFAVNNKIAPPEALEKMKKMSQIKSGPGGCMGPQECDAFCSKPENRQTCFEFTKQNQLMPPEELMRMEREMEIVDKLNSGGMTGPGGCKGPQECNAFCRNPENMEECINFSGEQGLLSQDRMKDMMGKTQESFDKMKEIEMQRNQVVGDAKGFFFGGPGDMNGKQMPPFDPQRMPPQSQNMMPPMDGSMPPPEGYQNFDPNMMPPDGYKNFDTNMMPPSEGSYREYEGIKPTMDGEGSRNFDPNMMPPMDNNYREYNETMPSTGGMMPPEGYQNFDPNKMQQNQNSYQNFDSNTMPPMDGQGFDPNNTGTMPPSGDYYEMPPEGFIPPPEAPTSRVKSFNLLSFIINGLFTR
ncbi:hypothetical protein L6261_02400 [Candidatus Parcubacteria bacterium]|nr:hypothetical protein [Candidatus Parcubacteria bacterium]